MRSRSWLLATAVAIGVQMSPMLETVSAQGSPGVVVISEFRFRGPSLLPAGDVGGNDEFIELYNSGPVEVSLAGLQLWASNASGGTGLRVTFPPAAKIAPGCHFLIVNNNASGGFTGGVTPDLTYSIGFADTGGAAILSGSTSIDQVGLSTGGAFGEGTRLVALPNVLSSYERKPGGTQGKFLDNNDNASDFHVISPAAPQNSDPANCVKDKVLLTHEVQGNDALSPLTNTAVTVRGVVTARTGNGFFLQTADSDQEDGDANTSEGLFVEHVSVAAVVGRVLHVTGTVAEFDPADPNRGPVTHLRSVTKVADVGGSALPAPYALTSTELDPNGSLDQLERFEGMRVTATLRSVSGTSLDGSFHAVLDGVARPFREPGIEVGSPALPCATEPCAFESFDGNPERLRVDSDGIATAAKVNLSADAVMNNVIGPLDFAMQAYTLLPESTLVTAPDSGTMMSAAPAASAGQYSLASLNLGESGAIAPDTRLDKAALMVRTMLNLPDVIAVQGADNAAVLADLALRINAGYEAHLDSFLVRSSRVAVESAAPTYEAPGDGSAPLFDRSPTMLRAAVNGGPLVLPQHLTVLNNQLRLLADVNRDDAVGQQARAQRHAQAEWLANFVQNRQLNDPDEAIVLLGNFNAHGFNDGYVDVVGTVLGSPAAGDQVVLESPDLVSPDLVHLSEAEYSSVANGNTQSLDHVLSTANLVPQFMGLAHARVNADFPEALRALANNPGRLSDRDPLVAYFSFPPDVSAPLFGDVANVIAEASGPNGAAVNFPSPTATDNLDAIVVVTCAPASGSVFPLGNSGVRCAAEDVAGNSAETSFTVTVHDTTAPSLTVPADIIAEAVSAHGSVVTFAASASDTVSAVEVSCAPASGSLFPLGTTPVRCFARDAAGNEAERSLTVTVRDTTAPTLVVPVEINEETSSAEGRVITFATSATDAVSGSVGVSCVPASGSTFPIGTTAVECSATDAAGNVGVAHFSVTVRQPVAGRMHGGGTVAAGEKVVAFVFDVAESDNHVQRGRISMLLRAGAGRPRLFAATVSGVTFGDAAGTPKTSSSASVDTVTFTGVGAWNGLPDYRVTVTASDRGEPGVGLDTFSMVLTSPTGVVVETISGTLRGGNVQSLRR